MIAWSVISWGLPVCGTIAAAGLSLLFAWWMLAPNIFTITLHEAPTFRRVGEAMTPATHFHRGESMFVLREWCINRITHYDHSRKFINGLEYTLAETSRISHAPGCYRRYVAVPIPPDLPSGEFQYAVQLRYHLSPWRDQIVDLPRPQIHVLP